MGKPTAVFLFHSMAVSKDESKNGKAHKKIKRKSDINKTVSDKSTLIRYGFFYLM